MRIRKWRTKPHGGKAKLHKRAKTARAMGESIACMIDSSNDVEKKTNEKLIGENIYLILIKRRKKEQLNAKKRCFKRVSVNIR